MKLTDNKTKIQTLLEGINSLPDAGSGGGGSVETCTVTYTYGGGDDAIGIMVGGYSGTNAMTQCIDGVTSIRTHTFTTEDNTPLVYENVVKNTLFVCRIREGSWLRTNDSSIDFIRNENGDQLINTVSEYQAITITGNAQIHTFYCYIAGTRIFLADGTTKAVEDIGYDDILLVWDFDNGCYAEAKPLWIKKVQTAAKYYHCKFADGSELKLVGSDGKCHRIFDVEAGRFESATDCVGKRIATMNGETTLLSCEVVEEEVEFYNVISDRHINLYAENILTSCRLNNIYPIENMKFVKDDRDIRKFENYEGINRDYYDGLRLGEQNAPITELNAYVQRLIHLQV